MDDFISELFVTFQDAGYSRYRFQRQQNLLDELEQIEEEFKAGGGESWERYLRAIDVWSELMPIEETTAFLSGLSIGARMALLLGLE